MSTSDIVIIKKVKKQQHAHHGGAWKIAYADFVTAMMAFFLLLWLISMTTPEQKKGLADYFAPPNVSQTTSGAGGVLAGKAPSESGAAYAGSSSPNKGQGSKDDVATSPSGSSSRDTKTSNLDVKSLEDMAFHSAAVSIRQAWRADPDLTSLANNLIVQETRDGLEIQIVDQSGQRMFPEGSKFPVEGVRKALADIAPTLDRLPNQITISGHTAAGDKFASPEYGSWELSSDRANVTRSILSEFGLSADHIYSVSGRSSVEPYFPDDPYMAANERVTITVMRKDPPVPLDLKP
ncbi:MAG TPA: flagellar motor protein MotB [Devosiaceae bacterium]